MDWQRLNIDAAAAYLREMIEAGADDVRTQSVYEGLLDVLDPTRYATRMKRTATSDATAAAMHDMRDRRRARIDRRGHSDRRLVNFGPAAAGEHRSGQDRRAGAERRNR